MPRNPFQNRWTALLLVGAIMLATALFVDGKKPDEAGSDMSELAFGDTGSGVPADDMAAAEEAEKPAEEEATQTYSDEDLIDPAEGVDPTPEDDTANDFQGEDQNEADDAGIDLVE